MSLPVIGPSAGPCGTAARSCGVGAGGGSPPCSARTALPAAKPFAGTETFPDGLMIGLDDPFHILPEWVY